MQIIPLGASQGSSVVQSQVQSPVPDLSPAPSNAEQSLMAHGLCSVYDPNQEAEEQTAKPVADTRAVIALSATPAEALDNRSDAKRAQEQSFFALCCWVLYCERCLCRAWRLLVHDLGGTQYIYSLQEAAQHVAHSMMWVEDGRAQKHAVVADTSCFCAWC